MNKINIKYVTLMLSLFLFSPASLFCSLEAKLSSAQGDISVESDIHEEIRKIEELAEEIRKTEELIKRIKEFNKKEMRHYSRIIGFCLVGAYFLYIASYWK